MICACGCNEAVKRRRDGSLNSFVHGHSRRGAKLSDVHRLRLSLSAKGRPGYWTGKIIPESARAKMRAAKVGRPLTASHRANMSASRTGRPHPAVHHPQSDETKLKKSLAQRGERGSNWQGGISSENERIRASSEYAEWRLSVFRRDGFRCVGCGARRDLHAHHIQRFAIHVGVRFEVSNGKTLCPDCHGIEHGRSSWRR